MAKVILVAAQSQFNHWNQVQCQSNKMTYQTKISQHSRGCVRSMAFIWFVLFLTKNPWEVIGNFKNKLFRNLQSIWFCTPLRSATHACNLPDTGLADIFNIQLDWRHKIVALQLSTQNVVNKVPLSTVPGFKTRAFVQHMESGPTPDTASFIQKMEEEKLAKVRSLYTLSIYSEELFFDSFNFVLQQRGETKDNRSFFSK